MTPGCCAFVLAERANVIDDAYRRIRRLSASRQDARHFSKNDGSMVGSISSASSTVGYSHSSRRSPDDLVCYGIVGALAFVVPFDFVYASPRLPYHTDKGCRPSQSAIRPRLSLATSSHRGRQASSQSRSGFDTSSLGGPQVFLWLQ